MLTKDQLVIGELIRFIKKGDINYNKIAIIVSTSINDNNMFHLKFLKYKYISINDFHYGSLSNFELVLP